jgi:hypothetical protein
MSADFSARFAAVEQQLLAALARARADLTHAGSKGAVVEDAVRVFLSDHLPRRLAVGQGQVVDLYGRETGQLDIIITNEDQPFTYPTSQPGLYLVEGVSATGEVKSHLTTFELDKAIRGGAMVKALRYTYLEGDVIQATPSDQKRFYVSPPHFLLAFESSVATDTLLQRLIGAVEVAPSRVTQPGTGQALAPLDAVFVKDRGVALNLGDGAGAFVVHDDHGQRAAGWVWLDGGQAGMGVLLLLLSWLHVNMPRFRRWVPVMAPYLLATGPTAGRQPARRRER